MPVVTGISDHYGLAEFVTLSLKDTVPAILDRRRIDLIDPGLPSAPYHHEGLALPLAQAESVISKTRDSVLRHCRSALAELQSSLRVSAVVIQESPFKELPDSVSEVLASKKLTYAADGMMYREGLASEASAIGLAVHRIPRRSDQIAAASGVLGCPASEVMAILDGFGKSVGVPWRKEHRHAAAAALCILASRTDRRR